MYLVPNNVSAHTSMALFISPSTFMDFTSYNHLVRQVHLLSCLFDKGRNPQKLSDLPKFKGLESYKCLMVDIYEGKRKNFWYIPNGSIFGLWFFVASSHFEGYCFSWVMSYLWVTNLIFIGALFLLLDLTFVFFKSNSNFCVLFPCLDCITLLSPKWRQNCSVEGVHDGD